jgi:DNA-binding NtrC family response regulator
VNLPLEKPSVLYVDGDPLHAAAFRRAMRDLPVRLVMAQSIAEAKGKLEQESFRFVMAEHALPDGSGMAFLIGVQMLFPKTRVVLYTEQGSSECKAMDLPVLFKPCEAQELGGVVSFALALAD